MDCEEVQICDICGDTGAEDELAICDQCNDSAEHIYCMTNMLDHLPLHWVCERCELENQRLAKKRLLTAKTVRIEADKTCRAAKPSSCAEENKARNSLAENGRPVVQIQPARTKEVLTSYQKEVIAAAKSCTTVPRSESEVDNAARQSSLRLSPACQAIPNNNSNIKEVDEANVPKSPVGRPLSGPKHVVSKSSSFPSRDNQMTFLLPSKPKEFTRSKSSIVQHSVNSTSVPSINNFKDVHRSSFQRQEYDKLLIRSQHGHASDEVSSIMQASSSTSVRGQEYNKPLTHVTHKHVAYETLKTMDSPGSMSVFGSTAMNKAGEHESKHCKLSPRNSDVLHFRSHGCNLDNARDHEAFKGQSKCSRCDTAGHVAAQCIYSCSSSGEEREARSLAGNFNTTVVSGMVLSSPKESTQWKSNGGPTTCKLASNQTQMCGADRPATCRSVNNAHQCSPQSPISEQSHEVEEKAHPLRGNVGTNDAALGKPGFQMGAAMKKTQVANAVDEHQLLLRIKPPCNPADSDEIVSTLDTSAEPHCEVLAEPCVQILWSGCFNIASSCLVYNGMQAHASTKADRMVSEAVRNLPFELHVEELKRGAETDAWPSSLQNQPPTSNSIGVYFFPVDMKCHDIWYKPLLDHLVANDLALKTNMNFFQLLIFPSHLLPEADQYWDDRQYLWGVLKNAT